MALKLSCPTSRILVRPGVKPESPSLEGGFLTPGPPGKAIQFQYKDSSFVTASMAIPGMFCFLLHAPQGTYL